MIINGDIKHNFKPYPNEIKLLKEFISEINEYVELILIKGNHDSLFPKDIEILDYYKLNNYIIAHGHKHIKGENFIISHEHPSIKLRDDVGAIIKLPIYLINKNYIVLPAFNPLSPGNDLINNSPTSPIIKNEFLNSEVIAISEYGLLNFGTLRDLREFIRSNIYEI